MSTIEKFEDLVCWQKARLLTKEIYKIFKDPNATDRNANTPRFKDRGLQDQLQRASVSVLSNIAEGFERGTRQEFLNYLYIAKGSAGEVRAQLYVALDAGYIDVPMFDRLNSLAVDCSRLLHSFIGKVKVSDFRGLQYKREKTKLEQESEAVDARIREILEKNKKGF